MIFNDICGSAPEIWGSQCGSISRLLNMITHFQWCLFDITLLVLLSAFSTFLLHFSYLVGCCFAKAAGKMPAGKHPSRAARPHNCHEIPNDLLRNVGCWKSSLSLAGVLARQLSLGSVYYFPCNRYIHMPALIQRFRCLSCFVREEALALCQPSVCAWARFWLYMSRI